MAWNVLLSKSDFTIADFPNGTRYIGSSGVTSSSLGGAQLFDVRQYDRIMLCVNFGALTGGTTPSIEWHVAHYGINDATAPNWCGTTYGVQTASSGGGVILLGIPFAYNSGAAGFFTGFSAGCPFVPPYMRIRYYVQGAPAGLTSPNSLQLYGIEDDD